MQKRISRALSLLIAASMAATILPLSAAAEDINNNDFTWYADSGELRIHTNEGTAWQSIFDDVTGDRTISSEEVLTVVIDTGVGTIKTGAFTGCENLTSIEIPDSVQTIGESAFRGCSSLSDIHIPDGITSIGKRTFEKCVALESLTLPSSVTKIGESAFFGCSFSEFTIPSGVTEIGGGAFTDCKELTSIVIPAGVTTIMMNAFKGCEKLTSITLPDTVTKIDFAGLEGLKALTSLTLPQGLTTIGMNGIKGCEKLTEITIPAGVTSIGMAAFWDCKLLNTVTIQAATPPSLGKNAFLNLPADYKIYVPEGKVAVYKAAAGWEEPGVIEHIQETTAPAPDPDPDPDTDRDPDPDTDRNPNPDPAPSTGGSSGGNGSAAASAQRIVNTPTAVKTSAANNSQTFRNYDALTPDGAKTIMGKTKEVNFDKTVGNKVLSRITFNAAELAKAVTKNVKLGVHFDPKDKEVSTAASNLGKYFSNKMVLVTYDQKNVLPVNVEFAARLDFSGLDTRSLYFYSYDRTTNKYTRIYAPNYFVDANGYVHFTAPFGGTVIITDTLLA